MEKNVRFWSGGIKWGEEDKFKEFSDNGYWQIGWGVDDNSKGAKQAWKNIKEVQIGDFFAFHGYGGQNDLRIYQVSNVTGKDEAEGTLYLKRLNSETDKLFHGKAPKLDKGGWFGTLFEITGKSAINAIFRKFLNEIQGALSITNEKLTEYKELLLENHNLILHGAPGTGKTHLADEILDAKYKRFDDHNPPADDLQQMIAYVHVMDAQSGFFVYPSQNEGGTDGQDEPKKWTLKPFAGKNAKIGTKPFCIPQDAENYLEFKSRMEDEEERFAGMLEDDAL